MAFGRKRQIVGKLLAFVSLLSTLAMLISPFCGIEAIMPGNTTARFRLYSGWVQLDWASSPLHGFLGPPWGSSDGSWSFTRIDGGKLLFWIPEQKSSLPHFNSPFRDVRWQCGIMSHAHTLGDFTSSDEYRAVLWPIPVASAALGLTSIAFARRAARRSNRCVKCGYDLVGSPESSPCSECGTARASGSIS